MQLLKYLNREVIHAMLVIMAVLLAIVITNMFVRYLSFAAAGSMTGTAVIKMLGLMLPKYVAYLLPISYFFSILLVYGKLFANSEMTVMFSCGMSWMRLMRITMFPAIIICLFESAMTLSILPAMVTNMKVLAKTEATASGLSLITPGKITSLDGGKKIVYVEKVDTEENRMSNVFIYIDQGNKSTIITAPKGKERARADGSQYLVLEDGHIYRGVPGKDTFQKGHFEEATQYLSGKVVPAVHQTYESMPLTELLQDNSWNASAEFQWRLGFPLAVIVSTLLALAIGYVRPRSSRYGKVLPAILAFIIYFNLISVSRTWLEHGAIPVWIGTWWVHLLFGGGSLLVLLRRNGPLYLRNNKEETAHV